MKKYIIIMLIILLNVFLNSCDNNGKKSDAYGNFEAVETLISSEVSGKLIYFDIQEGQEIKSGTMVGLVDTIQLDLQRQQIQAQIKAIKSKYGNIISQIGVIEEQKRVAMKDKERIENMFKENAATKKQVDDISGQLSVLEKQSNQVGSQNANIYSESKSLEVQLLQIEDKIKRSKIVNPVNGTVLNKYAEPFEIIAQGKPLYKIADLSSIILRVYVSGAQMNEIKIGQKVKVVTDLNAIENKFGEGEITWISSNAEFTPKIIQTKEERVNMVYAVKVKVKNDGTYKIGMPGEILFK